MFDKQLLLIKGAKAAFAATFMFALIRAGFIIAQCVALSFAIVIVWEGAELKTSIPYLLIFAACFFARQCTNVAAEIFMERFGSNQAKAMREELLTKMFNAGESLNVVFGTAKISHMLTDGISSIEKYISSFFIKFSQLIVIPLSIAIAAFTQDLISGFIISVCYPFIIIFMYLIGHTASDESARRLRGFNAMSGHFLDALRGMETLRIFGISKEYADNVYDASESYRSMVMKTLKIATLSSTVLDIFATCGLAAVAIMLGFRLVEGTITLLPALTVLMLVPEFFMPVKAFASDYHATLNGKNELNELERMLAVTRRKSCIIPEMQNVANGEKVAIVGRSGSGKTTQLLAFAGIIDSEGVDFGSDESLVGQGGAIACKPANDISNDKLRRIAYIPQHAHILDGTIRENVSFYKPNATDEEIKKALSKVGLADLIATLPDGISTEIGRNGRGVSAGQAQRIAIARALVDESRDIWILDEPGANLDSWTDIELKQAVYDVATEKTLIVATHRLHWTKSADRIINLDEK